MCLLINPKPGSSSTPSILQKHDPLNVLGGNKEIENIELIGTSGIEMT